MEDHITYEEGMSTANFEGAVRVVIISVLKQFGAATYDQPENIQLCKDIEAAIVTRMMNFHCHSLSILSLHIKPGFIQTTISINDRMDRNHTVPCAYSEKTKRSRAFDNAMAGV